MNLPGVNELVRRIENIVRPGSIANVDVQNARCRVQCGGLVTDWLPWFARRAGDVRHWSPPSTGEQCVLIAPGGDLASAFVLTGLYSDTHPAPSGSATKEVALYPDGARVEHDHAESAHLVDVPASGSITLRCGPSSLVIDADGIRLQAPRIDLN